MFNKRVNNNKLIKIQSTPKFLNPNNLLKAF